MAKFCSPALLLLLLTLVQWPESAWAEEAEAVPVRPYGALDAGAEAYALHEARRLDNIRRQLGWIEDMKWYAGFPAARPPGYVVSPGLLPQQLRAGWGRLDSLYAFPGRWQARVPYAGAALFEPWPYVPGDIWGYWDYRTVRQPVGQRQIQTGPARWESHPVYLDERGREVMLPRLEPAVAPLEEPAAAVPARGPREF